MSEQIQGSTQPSRVIDVGRPLVVEVDKKKKRKYSRGLRDLQVSGRRATKASSRLSRAVAKGIDAYRKASDKSSRKRRDGAIRDLGVNIAKGMSRTLRASSRTPISLARAINPRGARKGMRRQIRAFSRVARMVGWR